MVVLYFADIFGKPGRRAVRNVLLDLKSRYNPDFILANVENLAGGRGVNRRTLDELLQMGFHGFTSGNHTWDNKEVYGLFESEPRLIRPANYPSTRDIPCPGKGWTVLKSGKSELVLVNLMGRVFMDPLECPFATVDRVLDTVPAHLPVFVDMHADATSEKYAMGWHLAGRVAAVVGSHSHVQTADERLLPGGTAYITDVGMSGSFDSVIGLRPAEVIRKFISKRPHPTQPASANPGVGFVVVEIGDDKRAKSIERVRMLVASEEIPGEKDLE